ncbi:hypothetical protein NEUTE1DRAFT_117138 [Neurospora tetrasperma FGSC 2508]|uniref:Uncharacterized protein n=1 Tax=Neurospora tetrasperma (strain FGSC 2508 / ATCC MYA-4615 / P0657) TaxID=510951 RepID=F8MKS7_NEUT8|nr:uncharacterized protein NEUTE1DRAFT_117138 [Neurospora tetrasperma FGSC 2508]EGO58305.1 hypothetical protein NEUTE1DRAFT_117138 [Neurospora tetrasperma FGSC 2508]EGZ71378.1 hypothetical protein NEUTE2DRAFT_144470 [Neurospora tetrasperma FGSC 2509]
MLPSPPLNTVLSFTMAFASCSSMSQITAGYLNHGKGEQHSGDLPTGWNSHTFAPCLARGELQEL